MNGGVSKNYLSLRHSHDGYSLGRGHRSLQNVRLSHANILAGQDHQPASHESRILPSLEHPGEVVQGGIRIAPLTLLIKALMTS